MMQAAELGPGYNRMVSARSLCFTASRLILRQCKQGSSSRILSNDAKD